MSRLVETFTGPGFARRAPWVAAIVALVAGLATMTTDPIGVFNDDGIYLLTAKAIAEGQGYVYPHLPGTPPAIHYPPVWPMLLAAVWKVAPAFPANIGWFKLINPVILAVAAALTTRFAQRALGLPAWAALVATVAAVVSVPVLLLTNLLLSEPLFFALLIPALTLSERLVREGGRRRAAACAALVALLVLVRTLGGVVLVATVLLLARERRWRELAMYVGVAGLLLLPWQLFVWRGAIGFPDELRGSYGPYLEWVADGYRDGGLAFLGDVVAKNLDAAWRTFGVLTSAVLPFGLRHLTGAIVVTGLVAALVSLARRDRLPVTAIALAGYLGVSIAWPFWIDRFLWVIWPLLVPLVVVGWLRLREVAQVRGRALAGHLAAGALALVALGHTGYSIRGLSNGWQASASRDMTAAGINLARHINDDRTLDGKLLAAELAPMLALYTRERVLPVEILTPREHVVDKTPGDHVAELERIDRRFRPDAYVVMRGGPFYPALLAARLDSGRTLTDVSPPGSGIRTLILVQKP